MTRPAHTAPAVTPLPGSQAALWRAAADHFERIEAVAYDGEDAIDTIGDIDGALAELVTTLRPLAPLWARHLRAQAAVAEIRERTSRIVHRDDTLTAIANTILDTTGRTTT